MKLQLENIHFLNVNLNTMKNEIQDEEVGSTLTVGSALDEDNKTKFYILLKVELASKDVKIEVESQAIFISDTPFDESFVESPFVKINAPAIAFPYLRTFISNLTLNCGLKPIILPSINFTDQSQFNQQ